MSRRNIGEFGQPVERSSGADDGSGNAVGPPGTLLPRPVEEGVGQSGRMEPDSAEHPGLPLIPRILPRRRPYARHQVSFNTFFFF